MLVTLFSVALLICLYCFIVIYFNIPQCDTFTRFLHTI